MNTVTSHHCCPGSDVTRGTKPQAKGFFANSGALSELATPLPALLQLKSSLQIQQQHWCEPSLRHFTWPGGAVTSEQFQSASTATRAHQNGHSHRPTGVRNKHRLCRYPGAEQSYKNDDVYFHGKIRK